jgi:4-azaleucine resistance transporter AzlC
VRAALPVVLGYLGIGFAAGVVERSAGMSYAEVLLIATVLYAGSAQFVVTSLLSLAAPPSAIVLTVFILNLRHLLLAAALAPRLAGVAPWKSALLGLQLTDETFVVAASRAAWSPAWMAGLNLSAWLAWGAANLAGAAFSGAADTRVLAFALPCMFAGLLVLQTRNRKSISVPLLVGTCSALLALILHQFWPGPAVVMLATVFGATLGLVLQRWTSARNSSA